MKSLVLYIQESLQRHIYEGGMSVENASPIPGDKAKEVADKIISIIKNKFKCECAPLGSTGKKRKDQESGDIDIALEKNWGESMDVIHFVQDDMENVSSFGNINDKLQVFNFGYEWEPGKIVQVDFMFVEDIEFAEFVYHSPDFRNNESKYKGMYQSTLLIATAKAVPVENEENGNDYWWEYSFSQTEGLKVVKKTNIGKNGKPVKTPKKIEEKLVTKKIPEILKIILGDKATKEDCNSFESLMNYLASDKFKHHDKFKEIKEYFFNDWQLKLKTSKELIEELENYMNEKFDL